MANPEIHKRLVEFVSEMKQYQKPNGKSRFPIQQECVDPKTKIKADALDAATLLMLEILNTGGSNVQFDLYKLHQAYFLDKKKRAAINDIIGC